MVDRILSVGDDFTLRPSVKVADANLPATSNAAAIAAKLGAAEAATTYAAKSVETSKLDAAEKGAASGVAALDVGSKLLEANMPTRLGDAALSATIGTQVLPKLDKAEAATNYARRMLSGGFELKDPWPAVHPSPPTISHATTKASTGTQQTINAASPRVRTYGDPGTLDINNGGKSGTAATITGYEFIVEGTTYVEITWYESVANAHRVWVWLDDQPATAAPVVAIATGTGTRVFTLITLPDSNRHRIGFYGGEFGGIGNIYLPVTAVIYPAPPKIKLGWVGDSYSDGTSYCHESLSHPFTVARMLNMELIPDSVGSMGYIQGAQYMNSQVRLDRMDRGNPDLIVFDGSVNDPDTMTIAQIKAVWDSYAAICPGVPFVVFGPQTSSATSTLTAARATVNANMKTAASQHPSVIAYFDMVGNADTGTVPAAWSSGTTTYVKGDKVTYLGSIWQAAGTKGAATAAPGNTADWILLSDGSFGTGQVGTTTGNGNRDVVLAPDGVHPYGVIASNMLANNRALLLLKALRGLPA